MIFKDGMLYEDVTLEAGWAMRNQILSWLDGNITYDTKGQKVTRFYFDKKGVLQYEKERGFINPQTVIRNIGSTRKGSLEIEELFGSKIMDFPKPKNLIKFLVNLDMKSDDYVLDFFAGSGTTAHSILELNYEDGVKRKFILVQLPEKTDERSEAFKAGYKTIADICKERIRRVIHKIEEERKPKPQEKLIPDEVADLDLGFKVFKLKPSNFKQWQTNLQTTEELVVQIDYYTDPVKPEAEEENMLYELLLKSGYDLNCKIEKKVAGTSHYYLINSNELTIQLTGSPNEVITDILSIKPKKVIMLDRLFEDNDQLKTNTFLQFKDAGVDFRTV